MSKAVSAAQVMDLLNELFTLFDKLARHYNVSVISVMLVHCGILYLALGFSSRDVCLQVIMTGGQGHTSAEVGGDLSLA